VRSDGRAGICGRAPGASLDNLAEAESASSTADDDRHRSRYVRRLIQELDAGDVQRAPAKVPRVLVQFWDDPTTMPADVRECLDSWGQLEEQGFERLLFDDEGARAFIAKHFGRRYSAAFEQCRHPAMRCDYFRLCFVARNGGFYVDAEDVYQGGDFEYLFRDNRLKLQRKRRLARPLVSGTMFDVELFRPSRKNAGFFCATDFSLRDHPESVPSRAGFLGAFPREVRRDRRRRSPWAGGEPRRHERFGVHNGLPRLRAPLRRGRHRGRAVRGAPRRAGGRGRRMRLPVLSMTTSHSRTILWHRGQVATGVQHASHHARKGSIFGPSTRRCCNRLVPHACTWAQVP
jgi:hypothetical protein